MLCPAAWLDRPIRFGVVSAGFDPGPSWRSCITVAGQSTTTTGGLAPRLEQWSCNRTSAVVGADDQQAFAMVAVPNTSSGLYVMVKHLSSGACWALTASIDTSFTMDKCDPMSTDQHFTPVPWPGDRYQLVARNPGVTVRGLLCVTADNGRRVGAVEGVWMIMFSCLSVLSQPYPDQTFALDAL